MVELNQRTGRDPRNTREPIIQQLTQAITLAPSIGSQKHTSCYASMLTVNCVWVRRDKSIENGLHGVWTAPPWGGQKHYYSPLSPSRRETLGCGSGPSETEALSLSDTPLVPARRPQLVASFKSITVPQTQKQDETSRATRHRRKLRISLTVFSEDWVSSEDTRKAREGILLSIGWQKFVLYVFIVYIMMLLSKGTETLWISGMNGVIFCKALAAYQLYVPWVAITLVYNQRAYSLFY